MKPAGKLTIVASGDREIVMTRVFAAPQARVFEALTKPVLIQRWLLGPDGWTMPVCTVDLRMGGSYRYVWRNADGREMGMGGVFREVLPPERIVSTEKFDRSWYPGEALNTLVLTERDGQTTLTNTLRYESRAARDEVLQSDMERGVAVSYDRLEASLTSPATVAREIVSSRLINAPRETVFKAFSDPTRLAQWWGPQGCTNIFHAFDFRPGGAWRFTMRGADGTAHEMDQQFAEIVPPERIVVRHRQPGHDFSLTMSLAARGNRTELTWQMDFADPAEGERVCAFVVPANEQNFDRLTAHLAANT